MVTHDIDEAVLMADRALVMAGSPGQIIHDLSIDIDDPRDRQDPTVQKMRSHLMQVFHDATHSDQEGEFVEGEEGTASNVESIAS
jgi:NitT/TauT family transport system ATP-binding protein